jgi:hypothetical protein
MHTLVKTEEETKKRMNWVTGILGGLLLFLVLVYATQRWHRPELADIWVINMDKSVARWQEMERQLTPYKGYTEVHRWSGTDGRALTEADYEKLKIPWFLRPEAASEVRKKRRAGEIGCYLSHRRLLEHLAKQPAKPWDFHLILEDDVRLGPNFLEPFSTLEIPAECDIFFLGINNPKLGPEEGGVARVHSIASLHAYAVRHSSIPVILEMLQYMFDPVDEMISWNADRLGLYASIPFTVFQKGDAFSEIQGEIVK